MTRKSPSFHIRLPPQSLEGAYSLKEFLSVLVEVVGVVFGVGVEVVLRTEVPVAAVPAVVAVPAVIAVPAVSTTVVAAAVIAVSAVDAYGRCLRVDDAPALRSLPASE